jgi:3-hydroxybutyrate dehydrogenase
MSDIQGASLNLRVDLSGRVALVTGSTSGMGKAIALVLAANGAQVVLHGLGDAAAIRTIVGELEAASGSTVTHLSCDLSSPQAANTMVDSVLERYGRLDILVNNAGIQHVAPIDCFPDEDWDRLIEVNLSAAFRTTKRVLPQMRNRKWGRIINTSSTLGMLAEPHKAAYVASKHGLIGLTRAVALEAAEQGITCNAICPGWVLTPLAEKQVTAAAELHALSFEEAAQRHFLFNQPTRRFVGVLEIASTVLFLCSEGAASITGLALPVDGGQTIV